MKKSIELVLLAPAKPIYPVAGESDDYSLVKNPLINLKKVIQIHNAVFNGID